MVLRRCQSVDSSTTGSVRRTNDSSSPLIDGPCDSESAASAPVAAAAALVLPGDDLAAAELPLVNALELSQLDESGRHMAHRWMRADVAAAIRSIHNTKKATIKQHY